jgi:hypothetical protein
MRSEKSQPFSRARATPCGMERLARSILSLHSRWVCHMNARALLFVFLPSLAAVACAVPSAPDADSDSAELHSATPPADVDADADADRASLHCECRADVANWLVQLGLFNRAGQLVDQLFYWNYGTGLTAEELAESHAAQLAKCEAKRAVHPRCQP